MRQSYILTKAIIFLFGAIIIFILKKILSVLEISFTIGKGLLLRTLSSLKLTVPLQRIFPSINLNNIRQSSGRVFKKVGKLTFFKAPKYAEKEAFSFGFLHDVLISFFAYPFTIFLLMDGSWESFFETSWFFQSILFSLTTTGVFLLMGFYSKPYENPLSLDVLKQAQIVGVSLALFAPSFALGGDLPFGFFSFLLVLGFVFFSCLLLPRVLFFSFFSRKTSAKNNETIYADTSHTKKEKVINRRKNTEDILLVGLSPALHPLLTALDSAQSPYHVLGALADNVDPQHATFDKVSVLGPTQHLHPVLETIKTQGRTVSKIVVTELDPTPQRLKSFLKVAQAHGIPIKRFISSSLASSLDPKNLNSTFRSLALEDMMDIRHFPVDSDAISNLISNKRILITGAGGSFGLALVRVLSTLQPEHLILLDHSEENLLKIEMDISLRVPHLSRSYLLCDITDKNRLTQLVRQEAPTFIFHLAGLKNTPLVETNPNQAVLTNIIGTKNVAEVARAYNVKVVAMPTPLTAANPKNILQATKRIAELYCQSISALDAFNVTQFISCRFDNFLGSTGSVVSIFRDQILHKLPITLTDENAQRSFIPIREATYYFLKACSLAMSNEKGTAGGVFETRISRPMKIIDLASSMALLGGYALGKDIDVKIVGPRRGESGAHEELHAAGDPTPYPGLYRLENKIKDLSFLNRSFTELEEAASHGRTQATLKSLNHLISKLS